MTAHVAAITVWAGSVAAVIAGATDAAPAITEQVGLIGLVTNLGLSGVFLWQWRHSETIREELSQQLLGLAREVFPMMAEATSTIHRMDMNAGKSSQEMVETANKLRDAVSELKAINDLNRRAGDR